jgi:decaprenylphosphoryl-5-phosphoribose phosphatase
LPASPHDLDLALLRAARRLGHTPARETAVARFSALGEHGLVWLAIAGAGTALDRPRRRRWARAGAAVTLAYGANQLVKVAVRRARPELPGLPPLVATPTRLSFPSAHATTSFAAARALEGLLPRGPVLLLASALALSRPWLGVHYPSDTLAGAVLGTVLGGMAR